MTAGGAPPELRLAFGGGHDPAAQEADDAAEPRVGLRLARAGDASLTLDGYRALNDDAAAADAEEGGRLAYVAASRARRRLVLSGLFDPIDVEGGHPEHKPRHSVLARLLPSLGAGGSDGELLELPGVESSGDAASGAAAPPGPHTAAARLNPAEAEAAAALGFDLRQRPVAEEPAAGGRPPISSLAEAGRGGSAARSLSYAALAEYDRCGYRFLTERVLGLGDGTEAEGPTTPGPSGGPAEPRGDDQRPEPPEPGADLESVRAGSRRRRSRLGFGRAVHALLERCARADWEQPDREAIVAELAAEGADPALAPRAEQLIGGWIGSPLLTELRDAGARVRPELPFRIELGAGTVIRGTIDLLAEIEDGPPIVIDYKTDSAAPDASEPLPGAYLLQRALYARAVAEATGSETVTSAHVFLAAPERPFTAELGPAQIAAALEPVEELVAGIRARRFEVTPTPHAALCGDCPARPRLCPHPPELTLARG